MSKFEDFLVILATALLALALTFAPARAGSSANIEEIMELCQSAQTGKVDQMCVQREMKKRSLTPEEKQILGEEEDRKAKLDWEQNRKKKEIQGDLCNRLKGAAYRQCWCESDASGGWRQTLCK